MSHFVLLASVLQPASTDFVFTLFEAALTVCLPTQQAQDAANTANLVGQGAFSSGDAATAMHLTILLQLVTAAMAKKSIMSTINFPKFGRGGPARAAIQQIQQPSKNDTYLVTPNTTRLVVLKVPHSGSTWFAALLNRFPRSYVKEESITKTRSNNVDPSAIHEHVGTSLIRPTDKMVASSAQIKFRGASRDPHCSST